MGLPEPQLCFWKSYRKQEQQKVRSMTLPALQLFIDSLANLAPSIWHGWALDLARQVVDDGVDIEIRFPLFRNAVFPALLTALNSEQPEAARWLEGLYHLLYKSPECIEQLDEKNRNRTGLLRTALEHDAGDVAAKLKLVNGLASRLDYAIHEIPDGVLWDANGASIEQCVLLREELDEFCELAESANLLTNYRDLVEECRLHFNVYPKYLADPRGESSYEAYLLRFFNDS